MCFSPGSSEDRLLAITGQLLDTLPNQTAEAQERDLALGHLTRVGRTRVNAREVVEKLCLESLGSVSEFSPPIEGIFNLCRDWMLPGLNYSEHMIFISYTQTLFLCHHRHRTCPNCWS